MQRLILRKFKPFDAEARARIMAKKIINLVLLLCCGWHLEAIASHQFVHPGGTVNQTELANTKKFIRANKEPWVGQFKQILQLATPYQKNLAPKDGMEGEQKDDARKAYANVLAWYYTGNDEYAKNAINIFKVWSNSFQGYQLPALNAGNQSQLNAAWIGSLLAPAAEILRGYSGWKKSDQQNLKKLFQQKFYPILNQISFYNGNIDLTQIDAMMNMAVFCDDETEFNLGIERLRARSPAYFYLASDTAESRVYGGSDNTKWFNPRQWVDGLTQETCRDLGHHAQYGLASALHAAEVAHNQGVDIYGEQQTRYLAALELMAKEFLKGSRRFSDICSEQANGYNSSNKDDFFDTWEMGYNHYHNRKHIDMPYTQQLIATKIRPQGKSDWNIFFETLTHGSTL